MSVAKRIREPRADYLELEEPVLLRGFELLTTSERGVTRLRKLIVSLATRGALSLSENAFVPTIQEGTDATTFPRAWQSTKLSQLGSWAIGSGFPTAEQGRQGLPILFAKVSDMNLPGNEREIVTTNNTINLEAANRMRVNVHPPGTVIFPKIGGAIATNKRRLLVHPTAIDNNCLGITPNSFCIPTYLHLLLTSLDFAQYQAGTSVPALSQGTLGDIPVGLPPLAEQHRIVARVEELMALCDELEARGRLADEQHARLITTLFDALTASDCAQTLEDNWQRIATHFDLLLDRPRAIDALEQTILQLAVRGLLVPQDASDEPASKLLARIRAGRDHLIAKGELKRDKPLLAVTSDEEPFPPNSGWLWTRIAQFCEVQGGIQKTPLRRPMKNHYPYLRVANVQRNALELDEIERYELTDDEVEKWRLRSGDLLVVEGNGSEDEIGRCAMWDGSIDSCVFQNHLIRVRPDVASTVEFLKLFLNSPDGTAEMKRLAITTSGLFNLSVGKIRNIPVPLPPLAEQHRIVAHVEQLRRLCSDLRERVSQSRDVQTHLAETLVMRASR